MDKIYENMTQLIGNTPLLRLERITKIWNLGTDLIAKLERVNPGGSVKDRIALKMIRDAEKSGNLKKGGLIIEPTSGNTGIGLAAVAAVLGYRVIIVLPDSMSVERRKLIAAYGAEIVLTPGSEGMAGAIARAEKIRKENPGSIIAGQFENEANSMAHYTGTGPEIWEDTGGMVDIFVAGVGTGGTLSGAGRYLKEKNPAIRIAAVEPAGSPVLSEGRKGSHGIQGIGAGFIPAVLDTGVYDEVLAVSDEDAFAAARALAKTEGILCGISSGAALFAAGELGKRPENKGKTIVVLLPDTGERYLSVL